LKELQCALERQGLRGSDNQREDHSKKVSVQSRSGTTDSPTAVNIAASLSIGIKVQEKR